MPSEGEGQAWGESLPGSNHGGTVQERGTLAQAGWLSVAAGLFLDSVVFERKTLLQIIIIIICNNNNNN